jgi:hypothetical protein
LTTNDIDLAALAHISADSALRELGEHVPELSFLSLVARTRSELTHSRIIAALFDPRRHRQAEPALRAFVSALGRDLSSVDATTRAAYERVAVSGWSRVRVRRELFRIDVVIEIVSPVGGLVIGIENKIDAAEQPKQVERYQQSLSRAFPGQTTVLTFLAPQKHAPTTADASSRVPVVPIDYSCVLAAVTAALKATTPNTSDFFVLSEIAKHLREELLEDTRIRDLARQLWKDHPRALELALEHRPRLGDIQTAYEHFLRVNLGKDAILTHYPSKGDVREIKLKLQPWIDAGFPFDIMLYASTGERPSVRLLLWSDAFDKHAPRFRAWAKTVNHGSSCQVDEKFQPLSDWSCWRRVFDEDEYPEAAHLQASSFDAETVSEAGQRVLSIIELLRPFMLDDI